MLRLLSFIETIKSSMFAIILTATALQVIGTAILSLFSFKGIVITEDPTVFIGGKSSTHVTINRAWVKPFRFGLISLLIGIVLSGLTSLAGAS